MFPSDNIALQQEAVRKAHLQHSRGRSVLGRFSNAYQLWRSFYEARAALADQNPTFAAKLLPEVAPLAGAPLSFPAIPTGVYWEVDKPGPGPGTVALAIDIAGTVSVQVLPPEGTRGPTQTPAVVPGVARQSTSFEAHADGLYPVKILVNGTALATLYIPVMRARFLDFRELSRFLAFDFKRRHKPAATDDYSDLLAALYAADAAAGTSQKELYFDLMQEANILPKAPTPIALSYRHA